MTSVREEPMTEQQPWRHDFSLAWLLLSKGSRSLTDYIDEVLASSGAPRMMDLQALNFVRGASATGIRLTDLAAALVTSKSNSTRLALKLEQRGLVVRKSSLRDKRELRLELTPLGEAMCETGNRVLEDSLLESVPNFISLEETTKLILILGSLIEQKHIVPEDQALTDACAGLGESRGNNNRT